MKKMSQKVERKKRKLQKKGFIAVAQKDKHNCLVCTGCDSCSDGGGGGGQTINAINLRRRSVGNAYLPPFFNVYFEQFVWQNG